MIELDQPYLTDQLIPYIGNKRKLLPLISEAIQLTGLAHPPPAQERPFAGQRPLALSRPCAAGAYRSAVFFDPFAGSGVVSRFAKTLGFQVIANDWEPYSEVINQAYIAANHAPAFERLGGIEAAVSKLNSLPGRRGYIATHYCPAAEKTYDPERERMFYTPHNGRRIDAIREQIARWRSDDMITAREEACLLAPLIYQASYCSNTSGVFKGFHRGWGGSTRTAWYRIKSRLALREPVFFDNGQPNLVLREDAAALADRIECDIAYLDPPYNQHQYGSNYHLLNTIALWDKPEIARHISGNGARDKAAIRCDWRTLRRSPYCYRATALEAFAGLVTRLRARFVLVSYSTDGIIDVEDLLRTLAGRGSLRIVRRQYKRYRVSSQRPSPRPHTVEFVAVVDTHEAAAANEVVRAVAEVMAEP